jgi:hypothetical protein
MNKPKQAGTGHGHGVGENALQRIVRHLKSLNQELIRDGESVHIDLTVEPDGTGKLTYKPYMAEHQRLYGGTLEMIEEWLTATQLERILLARADADQ